MIRAPFAQVAEVLFGVLDAIIVDVVLSGNMKRADVMGRFNFHSQHALAKRGRVLSGNLTSFVKMLHVTLESL